MKIQMKKEDDGSYSIYAKVAGQTWHLVVYKESYTVANQIAYYLRNPKVWDNNECCEVAEAIREGLARVAQ